MRNLTKNEVKEVVGAKFYRIWVKKKAPTKDENPLVLVEFDQGISFEEQDAVWKLLIKKPIKAMVDKEPTYEIEAKIIK